MLYIACLMLGFAVASWLNYKQTANELKNMELKIQEVEFNAKEFVSRLSDSELVQLLNERKRRVGHNGDESGPKSAV